MDMIRLLIAVLILIPASVGAQTITRVQLIPLSNYVDTVHAMLLSSSNYLYSQISEGGITAAEGTNIANAISMVASNGLVALMAARDTITSNGAVSFSLTTSNSLNSILVANDNVTSNALRLLVVDLQGATNGLRTDVLNLQGSTNGLNSKINTASNSLDGRLTAQTNAFRTDISNLQGATNGLGTAITVTSNAFRADVGNLQGATNGLRTDVLNLQGSTNGLGTAITVTSNAFRADVSNLQGATNGLRTDVLNLQGGTNGLRTDVVNLQAATNALDTRLDILEALPGGGGGLTTNSSQFAGAPLSIKSGVLLTNPIVRAGGSSSNATVGGVMWFDTGLYTNCCAGGVLTNMNQFSVPAHTLTNNGDTIQWEFAGRSALALDSTNNIAVIYGSQKVLDTGLQIRSNMYWTARGSITRTGNTSQRFESTIWWPGGGAASVLTNFVGDIVQTNGIATVLKVQGASRRVAVLTNMLFKVKYEPASI